MRTGFLYEHVIGVLSACRGGGSFFRVENRPSTGVECAERGVRRFIWRFSDDMKNRAKRKQKRAFKKHGRRTVRSK